MAEQKDADLATILANQTELMAGLTAGLISLKSSQPPRIVQYGDDDYQASLLKDKREFKAPVYQNGYEASPIGLPHATIEKLAELKSGKYLQNTVEVKVTDKGAVHLYYKNKMPDDRMMLMAKFVSFQDLIDKLWAECHQVTTAA